MACARTWVFECRHEENIGRGCGAFQWEHEAMVEDWDGEVQGPVGQVCGLLARIVAAVQCALALGWWLFRLFTGLLIGGAGYRCLNFVMGMLCVTFEGRSRGEVNEHYGHIIHVSYFFLSHYLICSPRGAFSNESLHYAAGGHQKHGFRTRPKQLMKVLYDCYLPVRT